jgi:glycosyltransferase involved in cell wall biosynthesis
VIRIGFDARWFNTSGVGTYVGNLLDCFGNLPDNDFEILAYEHADNPVPVENGRIRKRLLTAAKYSIAEQAELAYRCSADKIDLFHAPFYIVPMLARCPVVTTFHDLMAFLFPLYGRMHLEAVRAGYRLAARKAARIITISDRTSDDVRTILGVPQGKIRRIYNAYSKSVYHEHADANERDYLKERYGITGEYVLTLSASNWRTKNLATAIRALSLAEARSAVAFQSVIAGPPEGYEATKSAGELRNAVVTGFVAKEDLPKLYRHASAFLSVSLYEGFGAPLMEAMGCGCPAIVSTGGSLPEVAGSAAAVFACDDAEGMADEVARLLADRDYRERRRAEGIARAAEFSYTKSARETLQLYREVARKPAANGTRSV